MPRPPAFSGFKYCPTCDKYCRKERDFVGSSATCKDCAPKPNYVQRVHAEAIEALGNACMNCDKPYNPPRVIMHMMKVNSAPNPLVYHATQYARDRAIIDDPEWGKVHYRMLCGSCRPRFVKMP